MPDPLGESLVVVLTLLSAQQTFQDLVQASLTHSKLLWQGLPHLDCSYWLDQSYMFFVGWGLGLFGL